MITRQNVASKIIDYLYRRISLEELVSWAEDAMMEEQFEDPGLQDIVARLGLADVAAFGLRWDDCQDYLNRLGYRVQIQVSQAVGGP
jgi:hypothetical protein